MRQTMSLVRREFVAYFITPVGYLVLTAFLFGTGALFVAAQKLLTHSGPAGIEFPWQAIAGTLGFWLMFWVVPPLLTMRLLAEERSTGTLEMLLTAPLTDRQVVVGKFAAAYLFYLVLLAATLAYLPVLTGVRFDQTEHRPYLFALTGGLAAFLIGAALLAFTRGVAARTLGGLLFVGGPAVAFGTLLFGGFQSPPVPIIPLSAAIDVGPTKTTYIGLALAGAMFLALGLLVSSLVRSPIVAALLGLAVNLVFLLGGILLGTGLVSAPADTAVLWYRALEFVSVPVHFRDDFTRGVIDTRHVVLYVSVTLASLFLAVRSLENRRWQ